jgi:uncharacterized protein (DUF302 family)
MQSLSDRTSSHEVTRFKIETDEPYTVFCERFAQAVPPLNEQRLAEFVEQQAPWHIVLEDAAVSAPLGFFIFWHIDVSASMALAGNTTLCTEYLIGNYTIAERMFRVDPRAMLYVPLRVLIYAERGAPTTLVIEQPSSVLSSLSNLQVTAVGRELDLKIATLFRHLGIFVPHELIKH